MKVSVDLTQATPYEENLTGLARFKRRLTHRFYIRAIRKVFGAQPFRVIDIGTGSGSFLKEVQRNFSEAKLSGLEYDPRLVARTNVVLGTEICQQGNAENPPEFPEPFDCLTTFQVIEHLYKPEVFLEKIHNLLRPDGLLILTTPNLECVAQRTLGKKWHGFRDDHVSLKSVLDWDALIQSHGFSPVFVGSTFFSGIPWMNRLPLGVLNWALLFAFGAVHWRHGESFVGIYRRLG